MHQLRGVLVSVALLLGLWGALAVTALLAGVLPPGAHPARTSPPDGAPPVAPARDTPGPEGAGAGPSARARPAQPDAGRSRSPARARGAAAPVLSPSPGGRAGDAPPSPPPPPAAGASEPASQRVFVLGDKHRYGGASLRVAQLVGDARPELVVGLGDRFEVFALVGDDTLRRLARVRLEGTAPDQVPKPRRAGVGDVSGDGAPDLVLPFFRTSARGGSRGGGAYLLRGLPDGRLARPARFTPEPTMATTAILLDLDGRGGLDLVVGDRGRPWGNLPGTIQAYLGGARPRRTTTATAVMAHDAATAAHLDGDEHLDLVSCGLQIRIHHGRGNGRFEEGATHQGFNDDCDAASGDLDGDGRLEAVLSQPEAYVLSAARPEPVRLEAGSVRQVVDVDGDGRADLLGADHRAVVAYLARGGGYRARTLRTLGEEWLHDATLTDVDGEGSRVLLTVEGWTTVRLVVTGAGAFGRAPARLPDGRVEDLPGVQELTAR